MLVKDEADVIRETIRHLLAQVDAVFVLDNLSTDSTYEILHEEALDLDGRLWIGRDEDVAYFQSEKTTRLAGLALEAGYEWIVPCDADELWLSPHGRVGDVLDGLTSSAASIVEAVMWNHVATSVDPDDANPFRRMGYHLTEAGRLPKVAVRAHQDLRIEMGNHGAKYVGGTWSPRAVVVKELLQIRHFPYRSADHFVRKARNGYAAYQATDFPEDVGGHWRGYGRMIEEHGEEAARGWFRTHFFYDDPIEDPLLVYDPAPMEETT